VPYSVKLSIEELAALASLIGQPIDQVTTNGWSAELHSGELRQAVIPAKARHPIQTTLTALLSGRCSVLTASPR
jgi:hypothetical protein